MISLDHLNLEKLCGRWIPHELSKFRKNPRVIWCKKMSLVRFELMYGMSGGESWIYKYRTQNDQQYNNMLFKEIVRSKKVVY